LEYFAVAPPVEFKRSRRAGIIAGARIIVAVRNTSATPGAAINLVY